MLGIAGRIGSGKSTLAEALASRLGWAWGGFGSYVRSVATSKGLRQDREALQELGQSLLADDCEAFCSSVLRAAGWRAGRPLVIDGIRHSKIIRVLRSLVLPSALVLLYVETPEEVLRDRRDRREPSARGHWQRLEGHSTEAEVAAGVRNAADLLLDGSKPVDDLVDEVIGFLRT